MLKVLVIGHAESFVVRGRMEKMKNRLGYEVIFVASEPDSIRKKADWADLFVFNMDGEFRDDEKVLAFMKEQCMRLDRKIILIAGQEDALQKAQELLSEYLIEGSFLRPLDITAFLNCVSEAEFLTGSVMEGIQEKKIKKKILIVDDDPVYSMMIHSWLKDRYQISIAGGGMQALKWLATNEVDLILLDFEMPVISGAQVLSMLREDEDFKSIPVMFLTGKNSREHVMQVIDLKPQDYILKSILRDELRKKLADFFAEDFSSSDTIENVDVLNVDLSGVDLSGVDLSGVDLSGLDL